MNADAHDVHTAYISHISHITSYALANTVLEKEREEDTIFQLASSGFRVRFVWQNLIQKCGFLSLNKTKKMC